jgi:hypothetical protein
MELPVKAKIVREFDTLFPGERKNRRVPVSAVVGGEVAVMAIENGFGVEAPDHLEVTPLEKFAELRIDVIKAAAKKVSGPSAAKGEPVTSGEAEKPEAEPKAAKKSGQGRKAAVEPEAEGK